MASTPPPQGGGPSPMMVAQRFVKQYYQVLSTEPENIGNFYKAPSLYSHGQGNEPTTPAKFKELSGDLLKDRLFKDNYRLDLEYGAIDAQDSLGGGVLVVVTGHLVVEEQRRAFCHTFFLNPYSPPDAKKKQFYVHNDIMRFLHDGSKEDGAEKQEEKEVTETVTKETVVVENVEAPKTTEEPAPSADVVPPDAVVEEPVQEPQTVPEPESDEKEVDEPEAAVEETKEDIVTERDNKSKRKGKSKRKKSPSPDKAQPAPGSWASMVAHNASSPAPPSPTRKAKETVADVSPVREEKHEKPVEQKEQQQKQGKQQQKRLRDPDCTLVIKHVPENTKERDIREMFEPYAKQTKSKIVGLNVQAFKNLAFVDYDSPEPVLLALKETKTFRLGNRNLELEPKMVDKNRSKGSSSGRYNRGQGGDGSNGFRGSGRSGQHRRRGSGGAGRGDRGSGGRGGRGGR